MIRVTVLQPALAKYRLPVFRELAGRAVIDARVWYSSDGAVPNVDGGVGFETEYVTSRRIPGGFTWTGAQVRACSKQVSDVVVLPWNTRQVSMFAALARARIGGVPVVLWGHGYSKREAGWRAALRRWSGRRCAAVLTYNHTAAKSLVDAGYDRARVFVALNALDQSPIEASRRAWMEQPERLDAFQREHRIGAHATGATPDSPGGVLLFVSRLTDDNRVDRLIDSAVALRNKHPGLTVAIVGKGPALEWLRAHAIERGVDDVVRFLGAIYDEDDLAPWFCSATAFCYPENIGLSILHAFGYGVPVVTSDKREAQNPEIEALEHDRNGLTYAHGDQGAMDSTLDRLLSEPAVQRRLGEEAMATVVERFTLANMVDGMEAAVRYAEESSR